MVEQKWVTIRIKPNILTLSDDDHDDDDDNNNNNSSNNNFVDQISS
jgi:hypothetical protein